MRRYVPLLALSMTALMAADLPIRQIVLYKSGVGYFERSGQLRAGESARLDFKAVEMNDVLKSLTLNDRAGGKFAGLRYDSSEPLDRKLAEFPFKVTGEQSLSAFLDQMKGARVEMKFASETVSGVIVSARRLPAQEKSAEREQIVLLMDSGDIRTFDLAAASSLRFVDPRLQTQLKDYLEAISQARSKEKRSVYIDSADARARDITASYMVPMPVWKSSYRLIFGDGPQPMLEGWAIVDNTTGEDWNGVRLAVVSGRPVSFISRLYEPKYLQRQVVDLPEDRAQGPVLYEGSLGGAAPAASPAPMTKAQGMLRQAPNAGFAAGSDQTIQFQVSSLAVDTQARELGELFEYSFAAPVTVKKNESAMLPFLQQPISIRKLLIYSEQYGQNPMSAAELSNSTGKTLDGGPITVFDSASYAGEALMETLKAGDKRLISYAVDLGARVTTQYGSERENIREVHMNRGMLTSRFAAQETKTYTINNVDVKPKTLIIEHASRPDYKLLNPKPAETTPHAYRFEVKLTPKGSQTFTVTEERVYDTTVALTSATSDMLAVYVQNKALSAAARQQLQQVLDQKRQIASADEAIRGLETEIAELIREEDRIRQNIASLNNVSGQQDQVQNYSRRLAAQETQLASLRDQLAAARKNRVKLDSDLKALIDRLDF
jgi:hypothetical protein